jgi:hypothetical protein
MDEPQVHTTSQRPGTAVTIGCVEGFERSVPAHPAQQGRHSGAAGQVAARKSAAATSPTCQSAYTRKLPHSPLGLIIVKLECQLRQSFPPVVSSAINISVGVVMSE